MRGRTRGREDNNVKLGDSDDPPVQTRPRGPPLSASFKPNCSFICLWSAPGLASTCGWHDLIFPQHRQLTASAHTLLVSVQDLFTSDRHSSDTVYPAIPIFLQISQYIFTVLSFFLADDSAVWEVENAACWLASAVQFKAVCSSYLDQSCEVWWVGGLRIPVLNQMFILVDCWYWS